MDLISPLLFKDDLIINVDDDRSCESVNMTDPAVKSHSEIQNPYEFLGVRGVDQVPATSTIDPFRNQTPRIEGLYEWLKMAICLPIALIRLVLSGLALTVGFVATKFATLWTVREKQRAGGERGSSGGCDICGGCGQREREIEEKKEMK